MEEMQRKLVEFHRAMDQTVGERPAIRDAALRAALIAEEARETVAAILGRRPHPCQACGGTGIDPAAESIDADLVAAVDGLCDTLYVVLGTAVAFGVDIEECFDEVHRSNMAKASGPVREDGKRLKPAGWQPPRIAEILDRQAG